RYPPWMSLIGEVERLDDDTWSVLLQAQVGPFTRSKRLRMVRTVHEPDARVVFERAEIDGRQHATWRLDVDLAPESGGTLLRMGLHYGGRLWAGPVLERVLDGQIATSSEALLELLAPSATR
ncbi:MAG: SRPBCC family protein, partial [Actinomycetota bacterium]